MPALLETALSNTLAAGVLAVVALCAGRLRSSPAIVHCLWLLVLLKLVTPPLWRMPIDLPGAAVATTLSPTAGPATPAAASALAFVALDAGPWTATTQLEAALRAGASGAILPRPIPALGADPNAGVPWLALLAGLWAAGAATVFLAAALQILRFARLVHGAPPADRALHALAASIGRRLGLRALPSIHLMPGRLSPMLWCPAGRPKLLLPEALLGHLGRGEIRTLVAHELAHLRRRDHLVRYLELLVRGLCWWNPLAWWACRRLRAAEEQCCDAWVVWALPDAARSYADALLSTVEFLSDAPPSVPATASGVGRVENLKWRLTMIMQENKNRTMSRPGRLAALALAALFLPTLPALGQERDQDRRRQEIEDLVQRNEDQLTRLRDDLRAAEREAKVLAEQGAHEAADHALRRGAELRDLLDRKATDASDLAAVLEDLARGRRQDPERRAPPTDAVLRSLRAAIGALREKDMVEDATVLLAFARRLEHGEVAAVDRERDRERQLQARAEGAHQLDRLVMAFEEAQRLGDEARATEIHELITRVDAARVDADAEALARQAASARANDDERRLATDQGRLAARESSLAQRIEELRARQDEQVSRLAAKVEELSDAVRRLTQLAERR